MRYFWIFMPLIVATFVLAAERPPPLETETVELIKSREVTGREIQAQVVVPARTATNIGVTLTTVEPDRRVGFSNRISRDNGATWEDYGSVECKTPFPPDRDFCGGNFFINDSKGNPILLPGGTKIESTVSVKDGRNVNAKAKVSMTYEFRKLP